MTGYGHSATVVLVSVTSLGFVSRVLADCVGSQVGGLESDPSNSSGAC